MASPAFVAAALAACGAGLARQHFVEAGIVAVAIAAGVLNVLQYHGVWLAPRGQLHELEAIGHRFAGDGPALMTRRRAVRRPALPPPARRRGRLRAAPPLRLPDRRLGARQGPVGGHRPLPPRRRAHLPHARPAPRPRGEQAPVVYRPRSGRYYEVWQRLAHPSRGILVHMALGNASQAAGVAACSKIMQLAATKGAVALATATRPEAIPLATRPVPPEAHGARHPPAERRLHRVAGRRLVQASISVDGKHVGSMREELDWPGNFTDLGSIPLSAGRHLVEIDYRPGGWHPRQRRDALRLRAGAAHPREHARPGEDRAAVRRPLALWQAAGLGRSPVRDLEGHAIR